MTDTRVSAGRESVLRKTADLLLAARRNHEPLKALPDELAPVNAAEAAVIQDVMNEAFSPVGGWKIGSAGPEGVPAFCAMPAAWMGANGALFRGHRHRLRGVEAEIAFRIGNALPPRELPYTRDEVLGAIASCHPAVEVLESGFEDPFAVPDLQRMADLSVHGGFVAGEPVEHWQQIDWSTEHVVLTVDGAVRVEKTGSSPSGPDLVRLLVYLANEGSARTGGLNAGEWITTGSWTGATWVSPNSEVLARFSHAGSAGMQFADDGTRG